MYNNIIAHLAKLHLLSVPVSSDPSGKGVNVSIEHNIISLLKIDHILGNSILNHMVKIYIQELHCNSSDSMNTKVLVGDRKH